MINTVRTAPFDLEKALNGHPLITKDGRRPIDFIKAFDNTPNHRGCLYSAVFAEENLHESADFAYYDCFGNECFREKIRTYRGKKQLLLELPDYPLLKEKEEEKLITVKNDCCLKITYPNGVILEISDKEVAKEFLKENPDVNQ